MPERTIGAHTVALDEEGFFTDPRAWTKDDGAALAREAGLTLTDEHWKVLEAARRDWQEKGESPGPRRLVAVAGVTMKDLYRLFPKGPGKLVARVAGLPKPKACV
jgi:tRNA 2-thiouridine synthesizing protein E